MENLNIEELGGKGTIVGATGGEGYKKTLGGEGIQKIMKDNWKVIPSEVPLSKTEVIFCRICGHKWLWEIASDNLREHSICNNCQYKIIEAEKSIKQCLSESDDKGVEVADATDSLEFIKEVIKKIIL